MWRREELIAKLVLMWRREELIAKLVLMWRREERREMIVWLSCKHQAGHGCIGNGGRK